MRLYTDVWYKDWFRFYAEGLYADSTAQSLTPLPIDRDRGDFLNLFVDLKIAEIDGAPVYTRIGRQELLLGSQRLISTLDWANTRRTFQGVRMWRASEKFDIDAFWVQPVIPNVNGLSSIDQNQNFAGIFSTYRPNNTAVIDLYYLYLSNANHITQLGQNISPYKVNTIGSRYYDTFESGLLFDSEGMIQFGDHGGQSIFSGSGSTGLGWNFKNALMNPTFWAYYDYASGNGASGSYGTFNQLFPFGHYYLGWVDDIGRQNIQDANAHLFLYPSNWVTIWLQYHHFWLANSRDALYNAGGVAIRRSATGAAGNNVGDELDLVTNFHISSHSDVLAGYSQFFGSTFIQKTASPTATQLGNSLFYVQYSYRW